MNKKEQKAYDDAIEASRVNRSLRWSDWPVEPDLPVPSEADGVVSGWSFNAHVPRIYQSWSTKHAHGEGAWPGQGRGGSQGGAAQFSSQIAVLGALRRALEARFARALSGVDDDIVALYKDGDR